MAGFSVIKFAFYVSLWNLWEKLVSEINKFCFHFRTRREVFLDFWGINFDRVIRTALYGSEGSFWELLLKSFMFFLSISEVWRISFGRFVETAFYPSRGTLWGKNWTLEVSQFFHFFPNSERKLTGFVAKKFSAVMWKMKIALHVFRVSFWGQKYFFWNFGKFSFNSDLEQKIFGFVAEEISPGLSKMLSTCLYEFSLRCWY